uniref:DAGKa domain-containing protein n=1 Tax=Caenorhabditis japonica TaxID=281687 RepID=A0A8R1EAA0_CAEJA
MRGKEYKLIVAATLIALTTLTLLILANADIKRLEKFQFLPKFRKNGVNWTADMQEDIIIEVVALFGVIHVATSRVPNAVRLQNHRIAQCRHVRIVILGDEPIPVQVDGEPWLQPPGIMQIVHKNRAQMLARNPVFDATLKKWEEQRATTAPSTPTALGASTAEHVPFLTRAREFLRLIEGEIARLGVSSVFLQSLDDANAIVRGGASGEEDPEVRFIYFLMGMFTKS